MVTASPRAGGRSRAGVYLSAVSTEVQLTRASAGEDWADASGTTTYNYDVRNRLASKQTPFGTLTYTYDKTGNLTSINSSNPDGTSVNYEWDERNRLARVVDNRPRWSRSSTSAANA